MSKQIVLSDAQAAKIVIDEAARFKPIVGAFHGVGLEAMQSLYAKGYRLVAWEGTLAYGEIETQAKIDMAPLWPTTGGPNV